MLYLRQSESDAYVLNKIYQSGSAMRKDYRAGSIIFNEGDVNDHIVILQEGIIKVDKIDINGNHKLIGLAGEGDLMGFTGFFRKSTYSASICAITDVVVYEVYYQNFMGIIDDYPDVREFMFKKMESYMNYYINSSIIQSYNSIEGQLALILSNFAQRFGVNQKDGSIEISMKFTDEMLSSIIGTNRETVTRIMRRFKDLKLVSKKNRIITINDLSQLQLMYDISEDDNSI